MASGVVDDWLRDGFLIAPSLLTGDDLAPALGQLWNVFPSPDSFHDDDDPERNAPFRDEFGGIVNFPFTSVELSLLCVHPRIVGLAAELLDTEDLRAYSIESWAKYTGAASFDQHFHRDYLSQTMLAPRGDRARDHVELFVYLVDVPESLGPTAYLPTELTHGLPALPNWYPRGDGMVTADDPPGWVSPSGTPGLYENEVIAAGPAGTVVAYRNDTFHRATELTQARGGRYTLHVNFRRADAEWIGRHAWPGLSHQSEWVDFVVRATPDQLRLFGFPPPGHPYWDRSTLDAMRVRYPGFDTGPWMAQVG